MAGIGSTPALIVGTAVGGAAAAAFQPALEIPRQEAWQSAPNRLPDVGLLAELVAGGKISQADGRAMAQRLGFAQGPFDSLTWLAQDRSNFPTLLRMWRLAAVNPLFDDATLSALVDESLAHDGLDWKYQPYLRALKNAELPGIGDIAYGVVRGMLPAPSWVPVAPPTTTTKVKRFPQVPIDPVQLAAALGYDENMLQLMVGRSGLSMAPIMAAQAFFRGILAADDYLLAIAEGDLRTEWGDAVREVARQIPTVGEAAQYELRGFTDRAGRLALTELHGMSDAHSDVVFDVAGRAPAVHAITTGLARGATYPSDYSTIPEPYKASIQRSDIRPEFADIAYQNRYLYPSAFVLRSLAQAGDLGDQAAVEQILLEIGWKPSFAKQVSTAWVGGTGAADKHTAKAQTSLWTTTHKSYIAEEIDDATATTALGAAGVSAAAVPAVLALWKAERTLIRKQLNPAQIRKALNLSIVNPATGVAWTQTDAEQALLARGYDLADAQVFLQE